MHGSTVKFYNILKVKNALVNAASHSRIQANILMIQLNVSNSKRLRKLNYYSFHFPKVNTWKIKAPFLNYLS